MRLITCDIFDYNGDFCHDRHYTQYLGVCDDDELEGIMEETRNEYVGEWGFDNTIIRYGADYCDIEWVAYDTLQRSMYFSGIEIPDNRWVVITTAAVNHKSVTRVIGGSDRRHVVHEMVSKVCQNNIISPEWPFVDESDYWAPEFNGWDMIKRCPDHASFVSHHYVVDVSVIDTMHRVCMVVEY